MPPKIKKQKSAPVRHKPKDSKGETGLTTTPPNLSYYIRKGKAVAIPIIQGLIIGSLIAIYAKMYYNDPQVIQPMINNLQRQRIALRRTVNELRDLSTVQAETPDLRFATEAQAEIVPQRATGDSMTEDEADFLESVNIIRNSGKYPTKEEQDKIISNLRNMFNF